MRKCFFILLLLALDFSLDPFLAAQACFDFESKTLQPLHPPPSVFQVGKDDSKSSQGELNWAQISGVVEKPISALYQTLLDPHTIRNGDDTQVEATEIKTEHYLKKIEQNITIKPVFFLTLNWKEIWAYSLKAGTIAAPQEILISYEKMSGTSHIHHLCGNILLKTLKPEQTGVYLYEELNADRRNAQDVLNGITGTLKTLRDGRPHPNSTATPTSTPESKAKQYKN